LGMQKYLKELHPSSIEDLIAMNALYRPGPMDYIPDFIDRKHGRMPITYDIPVMEKYLKDTYGITVYQEQVMLLSRQLANFTRGESDQLRKAMGKKIKEEMDRLKGKFIEGAQAQGLDGKKSGELFELILHFASYGFNKSHAAAYTYVTFQTAYLKTYYPAEFMAALITSEETNADKISRYIDECKRLDIAILPPSVNKSAKEFSVVSEGGKDAIIYGLGAIKGVGGAAIENILEEQAKGEFKDIDDFVSRVDNFKVNKKVFESLIKSGSFDSFGLTRKMMLNNLDNIVEACKNAATIKKNAAESLFGDDESMGTVKTNLVNDSSELELKTKLKFELESVGIYLSGHPLDEYREQISKIRYTLSDKFDELPENGEMLLVGKIEDLTTRISKKNGKKMGTIEMLDLYGTVEIAVFDRQLGAVESMSPDERDLPHVFKVRYSKDGQFMRINLDKILSLEEAANMDFSHPLEKFKEQIEQIKHTPSKDFGKIDKTSEILVVGKISEAAKIVSKKTGREFMMLSIMDLFSTFKVAAFDPEMSLVENLTDEQREAPLAFKVRYSRDDQGARINLIDVVSLEDARDMNFQSRSFRQRKSENGNYQGGRQGGLAGENRAKRELEDLVLELNLDEANKEIIAQIYRAAIGEHRAAADKNNKRLIIRIKDAQEGRALVYTTEFIVGDGFEERALGLKQAV